jgi:hypothetical protein
VVVATCVADLHTPLFATPTESYEGPPCQCCGSGKCELICRSPGCDVACHARCFTAGQDKWPSVMGDYNGITLRRNDGCCGTWVCTEHVVSWIYSKLPGGWSAPSRHPSSSGRVGARATAYLVLLKELGGCSQQHLFGGEANSKFRGRNGSAHTWYLRYEPEICTRSGLAAAWYMALRASKAKVQSLGADSSALGQL